MQSVDMVEAGSCLPDLIAKSMDGHDVIISKGGQPVVRIVPLQKRKRCFGSAKGLIKIATDFNEPLDDFKEYM